MRAEEESLLTVFSDLSLELTHFECEMETGGPMKTQVTYHIIIIVTMSNVLTALFDASRSL